MVSAIEAFNCLSLSSYRLSNILCLPKSICLRLPPGRLNRWHGDAMPLSLSTNTTEFMHYKKSIFSKISFFYGTHNMHFSHSGFISGALNSEADRKKKWISQTFRYIIIAITMILIIFAWTIVSKSLCMKSLRIYPWHPYDTWHMKSGISVSKIGIFYLRYRWYSNS